MGEDEPVAKRACLGCEDDYFMDVYSFVQPGQKSQLCLYLTKGGGKSRQAFLQEEQSRLGMMRVHVDKFCLKEKEAWLIIAVLKTGDFEAVKRIERKKIDQFTLPEKLTYTLPHGSVASLKISVKLTSERDELLLETEQLEINLPSTPLFETKPAVEHGNNPE
ncbi:uncharacterized protein [Pocillopora verrucosa]|uniref:uncharacterized protein n=1 Tax=Pocillopora verrucosa TaxID=203993 RepID=UPI00334002C8